MFFFFAINLILMIEFFIKNQILYLKTKARIAQINNILQNIT